MLDYWKKKIKDLFDKNTQNRDNSMSQTAYRNNQDIEARVDFQYPRKKPFPFPAIPDKNVKKETTDTPAFARKRRDHTYTPHEIGVNRRTEMTKTENRKPFKPSQVASPIYGYEKRKRAKDVDNIPAYIRKKEEAAKPFANDGINPQQQGVPELNQVTEQNEKKPVMPNNRKILEDQREPTGNSSAHQKVSQTTDQKSQPETIVKQEEKEHANHQYRSNKQRNHRQQYAHKHPEKTTQGKPVPIPFNVMMSTNDKYHYSKRNQNAAPGTGLPKNKGAISDIPFYLLNDTEKKSGQDSFWMKEQQQLLEQTLEHFHVKASVVNLAQGPSVTRFEVHPELGVKVSKIKNLSDDLKLNMAAKDIRIEAPIPGKNTVGIEIPNKVPQMVGLQEVIKTEAFKNGTSPLTIALGLSIEGTPVVTNIQKMPHGLIAGATGSGKSVCINTILISLLYKTNYEDVKFLLIDPKMVELAPYNGIPHLVSPVITDVKAATMALKWAVQEMEDRYQKFVQEGVRDIERFNQKITKQGRSEEKLPFIVIVIDELADLMMVSPQDVEDAICRIAQKARACGIHLLLATQRPSVDVITGLIKANIPTRIAFSVSSQADSRTIIDAGGAEKLLGKGDMLFIENGTGKGVRIQGAFVSDDEIERVAKYARSLAPANYLFEQDELLKQLTTDDGEDELFQEAVQFVVQQHSASTSLLQRHFRIGYNRAARLMDALEKKEIISRQNGSKPRDVLLTSTRLRDVHEQNEKL